MEHRHDQAQPDTNGCEIQTRWIMKRRRIRYVSNSIKTGRDILTPVDRENKKRANAHLANGALGYIPPCPLDAISIEVRHHDITLSITMMYLPTSSLPPEVCRDAGDVCR